MAATVLLVDDHPGFRAIARAVLEQAGYAVTEAADGPAALAAARDLRPALVLLDVHLPDLDGFAVAAALPGGDDSEHDWDELMRDGVIEGLASGDG